MKYYKYAFLFFLVTVCSIIAWCESGWQPIWIVPFFVSMWAFWFNVLRILIDLIKA